MSRFGHRVELDLAALRRDYESGMSLTDCARKHFTSTETARARLHEMGVELRPLGRRKKVEEDKQGA